MIEPCPKPEFYKYPEKGFIFLRAYDSDGDYGLLAIDLRFKPAALIHITAVRFSHNILKKMLVDWERIKKLLRDVEFETLVMTKIGTISNESKFIKFVGLFGFNEVIQQFTSSQIL